LAFKEKNEHDWLKAMPEPGILLDSTGPSEPTVSVIVPNHNGGELAVKCIETLLGTDYGSMTIIFVDNCSTDDSRAQVAARFGDDARLRILPLEVNIAFSGAVLKGFQVNESEYVVLMNNDMIADPGWLKELVRACVEDPSVGAVQAKLLRMDDPTLLQYGGGLMNPLALTRGRGVGEPEELYNSKDRIFFAAGACMLTSRKIMREAGLSDPSFLVFDDADLGWRIRLCGYETLFVPSARVMHRGSMTLDRSEFKQNRSVQLIYEHYAMILKNYSFRSILKVLPSIMLLHLGRLILLIVEGDIRRARSTVLGIVRTLKFLPTIWLNRAAVQRARKVSDSQILSVMKELSPDPLVLVERHVGPLRLRLMSEGGRLVLRFS